VFQRVRIHQKETFDSSATPTVGVRLKEPKKLAAVDLEQLRQRVAGATERAEVLPRNVRRERVVGAVHPHHGANLSMLMALSRQGLAAVMTSEGATDADVVQAYTAQSWARRCATGACARARTRRTHPPCRSSAMADGVCFS
jgi:hypothetical protein